MQFGCFVQLEGLRGKNEGLAHISEVGFTMLCYTLTDNKKIKIHTYVQYSGKINKNFYVQ